MLDSILFIVLVLFICLTTLVPVKDNFKHMGMHEDTDEVVLCSRYDRETINTLKPAIIIVEHNTSPPSKGNPPITNKTSSSTVAGRTSNNNSDHQTTETSKITTFDDLFTTVGNKIILFDGSAELAYLGYKINESTSSRYLVLVLVFAVTSLTPKYKYTIGKGYNTYLWFSPGNQKIISVTPSKSTQTLILDSSTPQKSIELEFTLASLGSTGYTILNTDVVKATSVTDKNATMDPITLSITQTDENSVTKNVTLHNTVQVAPAEINYNASSYTIPLS